MGLMKSLVKLFWRSLMTSTKDSLSISSEKSALTKQKGRLMLTFSDQPTQIWISKVLFQRSWQGVHPMIGHPCGELTSNTKATAATMSQLQLKNGSCFCTAALPLCSYRRQVSVPAPQHGSPGLMQGEQTWNLLGLFCYLESILKEKYNYDAVP